MPYDARSGLRTFRYRMPSTPTCTLSRVMQTCAGMSLDCSFSVWRYRITSMNGTSTWKPAKSVPEYLPSRSMTNALCCGTTTAVFAMMIRTSIARMPKTMTAPVIELPHSGSSQMTRPSTRVTRQRSPAATAACEPFRAFHVLPRS